jgi:hypothetical protein
MSPSSHSSHSSFDSLFDEAEETPIASRSPPPIPGLWVFPGLLSPEAAGASHPNLNILGLADHSEKALNAFAEDGVFNGKDQVMLFTRPPPRPSSLPPYLLELQNTIRTLLEPLLPQDDMRTALDQPLARQVILNLYPPGGGISPHIDLPNRYADGIIGVSLTGGTTMTFQNGKERYDAYMPERTIYVMTGEARWEWSHGIEGRMSDIVETKDGVETRLRSTRVSVTFRWMKEGAEVLD